MKSSLPVTGGRPQAARSPSRLLSQAVPLLLCLSALYFTPSTLPAPPGYLDDSGAGFCTTTVHPECEKTVPGGRMETRTKEAAASALSSRSTDSTGTRDDETYIPGDLARILSRAVAAAPEFGAEASLLKAEIARHRAARLGPEAEIEVEVENLGLDLPGLSSGESTVYWSRELERGRRRKLRISHAEILLDAAFFEARQRLLEYLVEVSRAYYRFRTLALEAELARRQEELAKELAETARKRFEAGASPRLELERAAIALSVSATRLTRIEGELEASATRLAAFLDIDRRSIDTYAGRPGGEIRLPSHEALMERLKNLHPGLRAASLRAKAAAAEVDLVRENGRKTFKAMAGLRYLGDSSDKTLVAGLSFPLGRARRNRAAVQEAEALARRYEQLYEVQFRRLDRRLDSQLRRAMAAMNELETIETEILPRARKVFDAVKAGYRKGELAYTDLIEARRRIVEADERRVRALGDYREAVLDVEITSGCTPRIQDMTRMNAR